MQHAAHTLPASHALDVAELVQSWGVSPEALFAGFPYARSLLEQPDARLPIEVFCALIERARTLTGEPALGFHMGMHMRVPAHGFLGLAAMTAGTLREALDLVTRFAPTRTTAFKWSLQARDNEAALYIDEVAQLDAARDCILLALVVGLWQIGELLTGQKLTGRAELACPRPEYAERFDPTLYPLVYAKPRNSIRFDAKLLDLPLRMANPATLQLLRAQCERALAALDQASLVPRVRALLPKQPSGFHTLEELATKLGVSARTLKRKLKAEGHAFSAILDELAIEQARELLRAPELSIEQVAERMGYSDVSNFGRAFRRWTGTTPAAYRKELER